MYTAIAQTRNINIEASSLLLENKHGEEILSYNKLSTLLYRYQYFDYPYRREYYI